ncbi:Epidermal growth factor receptor kinase substrate 8-like protein 3 [Merluccius polli]|uniref:Epidermal growth factor receptor kinase substrate 8-like protein 3 n=1 Tax=Merluccius polli TaxID=89951 RepID=A0AA47P1A7_MERPO|nr:Epidermal growth factor receptor kinase substrate 8-like protein 3 [Merluccius polli]
MGAMIVHAPQAELESLPLGSILQTKAVLDSCAYNSLLTVTVQDRHKRSAQVYMFQCEEVGAEFIKSDLDRMVQRKPADVDNHGEQLNIRNQENIIGQRVPGSFRNPGPMLDRPTSPPEDPGQQWSGRDFESTPAPRVYTPPQHESQYNAEFGMDRQESPPMTEYTDIERDTDILNHVLSDVELFMGILAAANSTKAKDGKGKNNKIKKKHSKKKGASPPTVEEYIAYLQKVKYGFNLLGKLNGQLTNPSAADFVHILFTSLQIVVPQYALDISMKVVSPMLTELALQLLDQEVNPEENMFWRALGECWNVPRTKWPDRDAIPPYMPEFYDGWQIPPRPALPQSFQTGAIGHSNSQHFPPPPSRNRSLYNRRSSREMQGPPEESESPLYMRVIYDLMARNSQELSVLKGDIVQPIAGKGWLLGSAVRVGCEYLSRLLLLYLCFVIDKSKQWWIVRNNLQEEGHVPQNVLEPMNESVPMDYPQGSRGGAPTLDMMSSSADVRAWLEYKGFSKNTVERLSLLNGKLLLGISREDMQHLASPKEAGKVFFQLQPIKSAIALASEPGYGPYNGRY